MTPCPCAAPTAQPASRRPPQFRLPALLALCALALLPGHVLAGQAQPQNTDQSTVQNRAEQAPSMPELTARPESVPSPARNDQARNDQARNDQLRNDQARLAQDAPDTSAARGLTPAGPARYAIVKAMGQGVTAHEAEQKALLAARLLAARHYSALGGAKALDTSPQGLRIIASHASPPMGLTSVRVLLLAELHLRPLPEPPPAALNLPVLRVSVDAASQITVEASRPCEVLIAIDSAELAEPELLPGGSGAVYRLAPGRPMQLALPPSAVQAAFPARLRVQACTGGLAAPTVDATLDETFAKARAGKSRLSTLQGVVSECVEARTALPRQPKQPDMPKRSMRQKPAQAPVNMTGAAGREAGLPLPGDLNRDKP